MLERSDFMYFSIFMVENGDVYIHKLVPDIFTWYLVPEYFLGLSMITEVGNQIFKLNWITMLIEKHYAYSA